jgi:hypothetical protein
MLSRAGRRDEGIAAGRRFARREDRPPLESCRSRVDYRVLRSWVDHARIDITCFSATDHAHRSRRGRLAAADFRPSDVGALRRRPATTPSPRRPCPEHDSGSVQGCSEWRPPRRASRVAAAVPRTLRAHASVGKRVRKRPEHDAADSPLTIEQHDCLDDCYPAIGLPQAACGPAAHALKDAFATQASGERGRGLRWPSFIGGSVVGSFEKGDQFG